MAQQNAAGLRGRQIALLLIFVLLILAVPLYQIFHYGVVFFANALDESNYLQYHHSVLAAQLMVRPVQRLVNFLHEHGLSGGIIHLIFDALFPAAFVLLCTAIFKKTSLFPGREFYYALALTVIPLLIGPFDPAVEFLHERNKASGLLYWITIPDARFPALFRTPEPQFSWVLLACAVWCGLHVRSVWPVLLTLPLLYTFLAVPAAFVGGSLLLDELPGRRQKFRRIIPIAAFAGLAVALRLYFGFFVREEAKGNILMSSLPLISYCGVLSLLFYAAVRTKVPDAVRYPLFVAALAPFAAANTQIISGLITAPSNFEQYFGVMAAGLMVLLTVEYRFRNARAFIAITAACFILYCAETFVEHYRYMRLLPPSPELLAQLKEDASLVAINHPKLAVLYNQIYPVQQPTFFSYSKVYWGEARRGLHDYLCAKKFIAADPSLQEAFANTLARMDAAYRNETEDDPLITLYRRSVVGSRLNVDDVPADCPELHLKFFLIHSNLWGPWRALPLAN